MKKWKKLHRPLPVIPGLIYKRLPDFVTILTVFLMGILYAITREDNAFKLIIALLTLIATFITWKVMPYKPLKVFLEKNDVVIEYPKNRIKREALQDFNLFIDEKRHNTLGKGYRYGVYLIGKSNPIQKISLYPSLFMPDNLYEIVQSITSQVNEPLDTLFGTERVANDYKKATLKIAE